MRTAAALICAAAIVLIACGSDDDRVILSAADAPFVPVIESSDLAVGHSRIVLTLLDRDAQPSFASDTMFRLRLFEPTEGGTRFRMEIELEAIEIEDETYYVAREVPLDQPGGWALAVTAALGDGSAQSSPRLPFNVAANPITPAIGEPVTNTITPRVADAAIEDLSGDPDPLPALYERSVHQLLADGERFLIVFATYDRCADRPVCARAVEQAKRIANDAAVSTIHVEPFGRQQLPEHQALIDETVDAWGIRVEPQFFVVDAEGKVTGHFVIVVTDEELREAVDR